MGATEPGSGVESGRASLTVRVGEGSRRPPELSRELPPKGPVCPGSRLPRGQGGETGFRGRVRLGGGWAAAWSPAALSCCCTCGRVPQKPARDPDSCESDLLDNVPRKNRKGRASQLGATLPPRGTLGNVVRHFGCRGEETGTTGIQWTELSVCHAPRRARGSPHSRDSPAPWAGVPRLGSPAVGRRAVRRRPGRGGVGGGVPQMWAQSPQRGTV